MSKFIKLPLIERWAYRSRTCDSRPVLSKTGILVNLDLAACVNPHSDYLTVIDKNSIPCSLEQIQRAWEELAKPITSIPPDESFIPYHPWWEGQFDHQEGEVK